MKSWTDRTSHKMWVYKYTMGQTNACLLVSDKVEQKGMLILAFAPSQFCKVLLRNRNEMRKLAL